MVLWERKNLNNGELLIRKANSNDAVEMWKLDELCFAVPWSAESFLDELSTNKLALYLVAEVDRKIVAYVGIWKIIDEGHITNVAVHPDYRRKHIAKALLSVMLKLCKENDIIAETLEVRASNEAAKKLYAGFGFKEEGLRKGYYEDNNEDAIIMWRRDSEVAQNQQ